MIHTCHAIGCRAYCPPTCLMCKAHWSMVPKPIQTEVWKAYRPGQCKDKNVSRIWLVAAAKAMAAVAVNEGRMTEPDASRFIARRQRWLDEANAAALERQMEMSSDGAPVG